MAAMPQLYEDSYLRVARESRGEGSIWKESSTTWCLKKPTTPATVWEEEVARFFPEFTNFANDNNLVLSDLKRLKNIVRYISDNGNKSSWIDHILCTGSHVADSMLSSICVINDVVISDHKLLWIMR